MDSQKMDLQFLEENKEDFVAWLELNLTQIVGREKWTQLDNFIKSTLLTLHILNLEPQATDPEGYVRLFFNFQEDSWT